MKRTDSASQVGSVTAILAVLVLAGATVQAADAAPADKPAFKTEELEQMLAPIALYPDSLLAQMLMASTYPLEIVQADRWTKQNKDLAGDNLTKALEAQSWDPSVKSLVNFPSVLAMMSENLDTTVKIGDAFIGQQKDVMATVQKLRAKAQETGNLKTTPQQTVAIEQQGTVQVIVIEAADPEVVYVPTYPATVYYAVWPYPAYPPALYYPRGYIAGRAVAFGAGVAVGAAWGYAWGHSDWHGGNVNLNINQNANINANINRSKYQTQLQASNTTIKNGQGVFQHDAAHRQGVAYRDQKTAATFGRASTTDVVKARESFRGRDASGARLGQQATTSDRRSVFDGLNSGGDWARAESARGSSSRSAASTRSGDGGRFGGGRGGKR